MTGETQLTAQYMPVDEMTTGPVLVDPEVVRLSEKIERKRCETQQWVRDTYGDEYHALFLGPDVLTSSPEAQHYAGLAMAQVLAEAYPPDGQGYPLPEFITGEFNTQAIAEGKLQPYLGFVALNRLTAEIVADDPQALLRHQAALYPVAVSARVVSDDGSQELGRSAKLTRFCNIPLSHFRAGALVLETYLDWLTDPTESSHVVRAEVRAAASHQTTDGEVIRTAAPTQELYFRELGLRPTRCLPAYVVGEQLEPFVIGELHRTDTWRDHLHDFPVYTPAGPHTALLNALCRYQTGEPAPLVGNIPGLVPYRYCMEPTVHGDTVYAKVELATDTGLQPEADLLQTLRSLDEFVPAVMVKVPAHTPEGGATQALLLREGFVVCGFEPAHDIPGNEQQPPSVVPPMVCMVRLGSSVRTRKVPLAVAHFPEDAYPSELRQQLEVVDRVFRNTIRNEEE